MEQYKTSPNVAFDVIYADGERHHVAEGVLFEADGQKMRMHLGTSRPEVLFATVEAMCEAIDKMGLTEHFARYAQQVLNEKQKKKEGKTQS